MLLSLPPDIDARDIPDALVISVIFAEERVAGLPGDAPVRAHVGEGPRTGIVLDEGLG